MSSLSLLRSKLAQRRQERLGVIQELKSLNLISQSDDCELPKAPGESSCLVAEQVESYLLDYLANPANDLPVRSDHLLVDLGERGEFKERVSFVQLEAVLRKLATFQLVSLEYLAPEADEADGGGGVVVQVSDLDVDKLDMYRRRRREMRETDDEEQALEQELVGEKRRKRRQVYKRFVRPVYLRALYNKNPHEYVENLLLRTSALELEARGSHDELNELLSRETVLERHKQDKLRSVRTHIQEYCRYLTKDECNKMAFKHMRHVRRYRCDKVHFSRVIRGHTDPSLGDCSFLNTCFHMDTCKYVHYEIDMSQYESSSTATATESKARQVFASRALVPKQFELAKQIPPQWIRCDLRTLDMSTLGKFAVVMADPPWDIHMDLPYGTMADDEMRRLDIPALQDDGYIFLWVTARAMELGRECLKIWGYARCDEIIWVKTNQLQRIIRTGRTGHWLNHGKEHCLVGVKGAPDPRLFNKMIDCDIIVAEVRATSHKPDEIYGLIERLSPATRKVELFGRPHNVQPNWITLGNQLDGIRLIEPEVVKNFKKRYPNGLEPGSASDSQPQTSSSTSDATS